MSIRKVTAKQIAKLMQGVKVDRDVRRKTKTQKTGDAVAFLEALYKLEYPR